MNYDRTLVESKKETDNKYFFERRRKKSIMLKLKKLFVDLGKTH